MTSLTVRPSNRWCTVETVARLDTRRLRRDLLAATDIQSDFSILPAPEAAHDDTVFKVIGTDRTLLVGIGMYSSVSFLEPQAAGNTEWGDATELVLDLRNDKYGFFQAHFSPPAVANGESPSPNAHRDREHFMPVQMYTHQPYPNHHASDAFELKVRRHQRQRESFSPCPIARQDVQWLYIWLDAQDIFQHGSAVGFNIVRHRPYLDEISSWNYCGGNGAPDASALGRLYLQPPSASFIVTNATLSNNELLISGTVQETRRPTFRLIDPSNDEVPLQLQVTGSTWQATANLEHAIDGRYRLYGEVDGQHMAPDYYSVDIPSCQRARGFQHSVLYDSPMSIVSGHYTPQRMNEEMRIWQQLGVGRVHVQNYSNFPSFWQQPIYHWHNNYQQTQQACGDYFPAMVQAAQKHGLEVIGDLKLFDLGFNCFFVEPDGISTVADIEGQHVSVIPEIASGQAFTLQSNPAWQRQNEAAIQRLRLYSQAELPPINPDAIRLYLSNDNRRYRRCRSKFIVSQGAVQRQHQRWTPAGLETCPGRQRNWYLEMTGLAIRSRYLIVEIDQPEFFFEHRGYMLADISDNKGNAAVWTVATNGDRAGGMFFWKGWAGWNNHNEPLLDNRRFSSRCLGLTFQEPTNMPTLLEPGYEATREIWLNRIRHTYDCGADGAAIRTYCHHNGIMHYLKYAFAAPVRETFRSIYGREPRCEPEDYTRIRCIRRDFFTDFMRDAGAMAKKRARKLIAVLESGIEVPPELDVRMQLPLDWQTWITEGLVDELRLKYFTAENPFVQEHVLPLARRHGVPVHLTSRCLHTGVGLRAREIAGATVRRAAAAGFDGHCLYEQQNLVDINPLGIPSLKGPVKGWFAAADQALAQLSESNETLSTVTAESPATTA